MTRSLAQCGPDGEGFWSGNSVFLGPRRLSIIDLKSGQQPMVLELGGKTHAITYTEDDLSGQTIQKPYSMKNLSLSILSLGSIYTIGSLT